MRRAWLAGSIVGALYEVSAVGELVGSFGDGVDRIVVFEPKQWQDPEELENEDAEDTPFLRSEIALLVAGDTPRGWLPFGSPSEDEPGVWELGAFGLQVFGVLDLDGDGTLEVAWLTQMPWGDPLTTAVTLSYYDADRGFDVWDVGGCSYTGCEGFLPREQCRGIVKPQG